MISREENLASGQETRLDHSELLCSKSFILTQTSEGDRECPNFNQSFSWFLTTERSYQTHSHNTHFKITGLELTIERFDQTHSYNITR